MAEGNKTGLINIDLSGEPLSKLIDVTSKGMGGLFEPWMIKRRAKATAFEIDTLKSSMEKNGLNGNLHISRNGLEIKVEEGTVEERAIITLIQKEVNRQINTEKIVSNAAENLESIQAVSTEPVDDEWIQRFFNIAQDINDEDMQTIWSKILSDEIVKPKSYSLRSLDILKNMSKYEAELFNKYIKESLNDVQFRFRIDHDEMNKDGNITLGDRLLLEEIGLIQRDLSKPISANSLVGYAITDDLIMSIENSNNEKQSLSIDITTRVGYELSKLVDIEINDEIIKKIANSIREEGRGNLSVNLGIEPKWGPRGIVQWKKLNADI